MEWYFTLKISVSAVRTSATWLENFLMQDISCFFFYCHKSFAHNLKFTTDHNIWLNVVLIFIIRYVCFIQELDQLSTMFCVTLFIQIFVGLYDPSLALYALVNVNLCQGFYSPPWPFLLLTPSSLLPGCWDLLLETCSLWFWHQLCINNSKYRQLLICNDTFIIMAAANNSLIHISY